MTGPISPLAPATIHNLPSVDGVSYSAVAAGVKYQDRLDVALMSFAAGSVMAGVFTKSATRSAPVLHCQNILGNEGDDGIAILVNSGNSNAFTGAAGAAAVNECITALGTRMGLAPSAIHMASTGVIGELLPAKRITAAINPLVDGLSDAAANDTARAIMTTDTFPKTASQVVELDGVNITIAGFAKGSGMIAPDMATMLGFLATDAKISHDLLQAALSKTTETSFNAITVDSDTSTSDSVYLGATNAADMTAITDQSDPRFTAFVDALQIVMTDLAHQIVRDGEGAGKFVEITVTGAVSDASAKVVAMAIANSPLIKTAVAGEDPNWGRIVMAVGKAGEPADRDRLTIHIGGLLVAFNGAVAPEYTEAPVAAHMKGVNINFAVDLGLGDGEFTAWTCDFTKRYIEINADYRS